MRIRFEEWRGRAAAVISVGFGINRRESVAAGSQLATRHYFWPADCPRAAGIIISSSRSRRGEPREGGVVFVVQPRFLPQDRPRFRAPDYLEINRKGLGVSCSLSRIKNLARLLE